MTHTVSDVDQARSLPVPQPVLAPLTSEAIFLVVCIKPDARSYAIVRSFIGDLPGIYRSVDFRRWRAGCRA